MISSYTEFLCPEFSLLTLKQQTLLYLQHEGRTIAPWRSAPLPGQSTAGRVPRGLLTSPRHSPPPPFISMICALSLFIY